MGKGCEKQSHTVDELLLGQAASTGFTPHQTHTHTTPHTHARTPPHAHTHTRPHTHARTPWPYTEYSISPMHQQGSHTPAPIHTHTHTHTHTHKCVRQRVFSALCVCACET